MRDAVDNGKGAMLCCSGGGRDLKVQPIQEYLQGTY